MKRLPLILSTVALITGMVMLRSVPNTFAMSSETGTKAASGTEVKIDNFSFAPGTLTVPAGTEVRWTNRDDIPHTVVSNDNSFKSKALDTDEEFTYTFTKPGTYKYFCSIHPKMVGQIVVQ